MEIFCFLREYYYSHYAVIITIFSKGQENNYSVAVIFVSLSLILIEYFSSHTVLRYGEPVPSLRGYTLDRSFSAVDLN